MPSKDTDAEAQAKAALLDIAPTGADSQPETAAIDAALADTEAEGVQDVLASGLSVEEEAALRAEGIDPHHPILTIDEQREAIQSALKRVSADEKKEALKAFEKQVYERERGVTGLRTGNPILDEMVTVTLDLAEHSDRIWINGHQFWHGHTYKVPRHVANSLREIQQRGHHHQADLDGKGISERGKKPMLTAIKADAGGNVVGIENAPQTMRRAG